MRMDRRDWKDISRMGNKIDFGLSGMRMERSGKKELSRMGKRFLMNVGMKMETKKSVDNPHPKDLNKSPA